MAVPLQPPVPPIHENDLPANFRDENLLLCVPKAGHPEAGHPEEGHLKSFLESDLSVERLDSIAPFLWMVGRPYIPRPLNIQSVLGREIVATSDASLHLVWTSKKVFMKPLPSYILSRAFYEGYMCSKIKPVHDTLSAFALGLLYTYLALIPTNLDFVLAQQHHLLPKDYKWTEWKDLTRLVLEDYPGESIYHHLPRRYWYGELRLSRLNKIYRFLKGEWLHGYSNLTGTRRYVDFLGDNLRAFAAAGGYIVIVLTAMQVALQTDAYGENMTLQAVCYGSAIFSIIAPILVVAIVFGAFLTMFVVNFWMTMVRERSRFRQINETPPRKIEKKKLKSKVGEP